MIKWLSYGVVVGCLIDIGISIACTIEEEDITEHAAKSLTPAMELC